MDKVPHYIISKVSDYLPVKEAARLSNIFKSSHWSRVSLSYLCSLNALVEEGMDHIFMMRDRLESMGYPELKPLASGDPLILPKKGYCRGDFSMRYDALSRFLDSFGFFLTERYNPTDYILYSRSFRVDDDWRLPSKLCLVFYEPGPVPFEDNIPWFLNYILSSSCLYEGSDLNQEGMYACYEIDQLSRFEHAFDCLGCKSLSVVSHSDTQHSFSVTNCSSLERVFINGGKVFDILGIGHQTLSYYERYENHIFSSGKLIEFNLEGYDYDPWDLMSKLGGQYMMFVRHIDWDELFQYFIEKGSIGSGPKILMGDDKLSTARNLFGAEKLSIENRAQKLYEWARRIMRVRLTPVQKLNH
jgi:hypothetical protein